MSAATVDSCAIVWFRNDLRLLDNPALFKALQKHQKIVGVYVFDEASYKISEYGFQKTGVFRTQFIRQSVKDLKKRFEGLGGLFLIKMGNSADLIAQIAKNYKASKVYAEQYFTSEEVAVQEGLESNLWKLEAELILCKPNTLYTAEELPFNVAHLPDVFTDFRKQVERYCKILPPLPAPKSISSPAPFEGDAVSTLPSYSSLGLDEEPLHNSLRNKAAFEFYGGETEALDRLNYYIFSSDCIASYKDTRNGLLGADYSSKLSAFLACGCLSVRYVYQEIKNYEAQRVSNQSTYWLFFELLWREYFHFVARKFERKLFFPSGLKGSRPFIKANPRLLERWTHGETGVPFVDANMRELLFTGFMSNRGRQNVASYLVKDLKQDWRLGAAWFEQQLIDYEVCANWGNWNYVAGTGNDPRENRYFNIQKQQQQYDPQGEYVKHWLPGIKLSLAFDR